MAEATIGVDTGEGRLFRQYNNAVKHVAGVLAGREARRGYCFMVSRAQLHLPHVPSRIAQAQRELEEEHGIGNVRILAFGIREIAHIAEHLGKLYPDGVPALTEAGVGEVLDALHDGMMAGIASGEPFPDNWAARKFVELLKSHAAGKPLATLFKT